VEHGCTVRKVKKKREIRQRGNRRGRQLTNRTTRTRYVCIDYVGFTKTRIRDSDLRASFVMRMAGRWPEPREGTHSRPRVSLVDGTTWLRVPSVSVSRPRFLVATCQLNRALGVFTLHDTVYFS
jgi:hypothetical protein